MIGSTAGLKGGRGRGRVCVCTFLPRCKKRAGLIHVGPDTNKKKPGRPSIGWKGRGGGGGGGDNICGRGTISASRLCPWGTISASGLCPAGQNLRGDRICSDTGSESSPGTNLSGRQRKLRKSCTVLMMSLSVFQ